METLSGTTNNALQTEASAADFLGVSIRTMQAWRIRGGGPKYVKMGKSVRYRPADLDDWIEAHLTTSTSAVAAK